MSKSVENIFDTFRRFLTFFDVAPFRWPLLRSADHKFCNSGYHQLIYKALVEEVRRTEPEPEPLEPIFQDRRWPRGSTGVETGRNNSIKRDKLNGTNGFLQNSAVSCGFLRNSAVSCGFLRKSAPRKCCNSQEKQRKSAKSCEKRLRLSLLIPLE